MKQFTRCIEVLAGMMVLLFLFEVAFAQQDTKAADKGTSVLLAVPDDAPPAAEEAVPAGDRLTRSQKRDLGILPRQLIAYAVRLQKEGVDLSSMDTREACMVLVAEAATDQPKAWADPVGIDWDGILEFIAGLLPLILKIIAIFGV